mgnify:CR=1 FL=1
MNAWALIALALVVVASLFAGAVIACFAPDWRVLWALWPLLVCCFALTGLGNRATPTKPATARPLETL